jgi:hypothetical protein
MSMISNATTYDQKDPNDYGGIELFVLILDCKLPSPLKL